MSRHWGGKNVLGLDKTNISEITDGMDAGSSLTNDPFCPSVDISELNLLVLGAGVWACDCCSPMRWCWRPQVELGRSGVGRTLEKTINVIPNPWAHLSSASSEAPGCPSLREEALYLVSRSIFLNIRTQGFCVSARDYHLVSGCCSSSRLCSSSDISLANGSASDSRPSVPSMPT